MDLALYFGTGSGPFAPAVLGACAARSAADGIADVGGFGWYPYALMVSLCFFASKVMVTCLRCAPAAKAGTRVMLVMPMQCPWPLTDAILAMAQLRGLACLCCPCLLLEK